MFELMDYKFDDLVRPMWVSCIRHLCRKTIDLVKGCQAEQCIYFESRATDAQKTESVYVQIVVWEEFYAFARKRSFPVFRWQHERFLNDKTVSFVALADDDHVYSYGWVTRGDRSYVGVHDISGLPILFDFETPPAYRGKGYYTKLLTALRERMGGIIYAHPDNLPSVAAIKKAGFVQYA